MNEIELLAQEIEQAFPDAKYSFDTPANPEGNWWLDVTQAGKHVAIEWRPRQGFGVSLVTEKTGPFEGPDEAYSERASAFAKIKALLQPS